jgi:hypothetical protein
VIFNDAVDGMKTDPAVDAPQVMAFRHVKTGSAVPLVDLIHICNEEFLGRIAPLGNNGDSLENAYYAAGQVYTSSSLDSLLAQSFYNPILSQLVEGLCKGGFFSAQIGRYCPEFVVSKIWKFGLTLQGKPFIELFNFMLGNDLLAVALYRQFKSSRLNCVITNPSPTTILSEDDIVFVCNKIIPK